MELEFSCSLNETLIAEIIETFVSHILHMRGQIPLPIQLLDQYIPSLQQTTTTIPASSSSTSTTTSTTKNTRSSSKMAISNLKLSRIERKINEFMARYHTIMLEVRQIIQNTKVLEVGILLGPSPVNPREAYFLHFHYTPTTVAMDKKNRQAVCRKFIRNFLQHWIDDPPNPPPIINLFISIRLTNENSSIPAKIYLPLDSEFTLRDNFSPQFRRKGMQPVHYFIRSSSTSSSIIQDEKGNEDMEMDMVPCDLPSDQTPHRTAEINLPPPGSWVVVLSRGIKGIKSLKLSS